MTTPHRRSHLDKVLVLVTIVFLGIQTLLCGCAETPAIVYSQGPEYAPLVQPKFNWVEEPGYYWYDSEITRTYHKRLKDGQPATSCEAGEEQKAITDRIPGAYECVRKRLKPGPIVAEEKTCAYPNVIVTRMDGYTSCAEECPDNFAPNSRRECKAIPAN